MRPRAIFFGSPEFAVPALRALVDVADVVTVVTQPDRPAGRGMSLRPPPVKELALSLSIPVVQPRRVRTAAFAESLKALEAEVGVVVAYGRILPRAVLDAPRRGCVNVHASILPRWRGAAPIHWAIVHGDAETGVCLMEMDEGMDTGPVISCDRTPIDPDETAGELSARLSTMGADLLRRELPRYLASEIGATPQPEGGATHAALLQKSHGAVDWSLPARAVHNRIRGMSPWPGAYTHVADGGARVKLHRSHVVADEGQWADPGTVVRAGSTTGLHVACGQGVIGLDELQLDGKRRLPAAQLIAGTGWREGTCFRTVTEGS